LAADIQLRAPVFELLGPAVVIQFDLTDQVTSVGIIHTASPGDATSANLDSAVVERVIDALAGTGKPYLQISGPADLRGQHL
jgi:hypothetical protein